MKAKPEEKKELKVKDLIELLQKQDPEAMVVFYERGSVYETKVKRAFVSYYDKTHDRNQVTLSN